MKKKVAVVTATRAEFGLLKPLIVRLQKEDCFEISVLVTGAHLSSDFGNTFGEIEKAGIPIASKIPCLAKGDGPVAMSKTIAQAIEGFSRYFDENPQDLIIVLGDRYEMLAVAICAMNARIPIAHIHGGETTEGAIDEAIRHSITKMSYLHFTSTEEYRKRVIQLGENPERVFNVGALGTENILQMEYMKKSELEASLDFGLQERYGVVTFHPVTLEKTDVKIQFQELIKALDAFPEMSFIITKANADDGGRMINQMIDEYVKRRENMLAVYSLGAKRYLSAVKHSDLVIGNSSSGIIEVPNLHVPTVNIGDRQRGRLMAESVINCSTDADEIIRAMRKAMSSEFRKIIQDMPLLYGEGNTSKQIVEVIKKYLIKDGVINIKKSFYDL